MENYPMKFRLISDNSNIQWEKLGDPKNWVKLGFNCCGIHVEKNLGLEPTIIIHTGQLAGFDPDALLVEAGTVIAAVRAKLLDYGVVTSEVGLPVRKAWFKTYTPEAVTLNEQGTVETQDGIIDHSKPDNIPHEERG
jgi:hypothetical protein